jgi:hypothetical protein
VKTFLIIFFSVRPFNARVLEAELDGQYAKIQILTTIDIQSRLEWPVRVTMGEIKGHKKTYKTVTFKGALEFVKKMLMMLLNTKTFW